MREHYERCPYCGVKTKNLNRHYIFGKIHDPERHKDAVIKREG